MVRNDNFFYVLHCTDCKGFWASRNLVVASKHALGSGVSEIPEMINSIFVTKNYQWYSFIEAVHESENEKWLLKQDMISTKSFIERIIILLYEL